MVAQEVHPEHGRQGLGVDPAAGLAPVQFREERHPGVGEVGVVGAEGVQQVERVGVELGLGGHIVHQRGVEIKVQVAHVPTVVYVPVAGAAGGQDHDAAIRQAPSAASAPFGRHHGRPEVEDEHVAREGGDGEVVVGMENIRGGDPGPAPPLAGAYDLLGGNIQHRRDRRCRPRHCRPLRHSRIVRSAGVSLDSALRETRLDHTTGKVAPAAAPATRTAAAVRSPHTGQTRRGAPSICNLVETLIALFTSLLPS